MRERTRSYITGVFGPACATHSHSESQKQDEYQCIRWNVQAEINELVD